MISFEYLQHVLTTQIAQISGCIYSDIHEYSPNHCKRIAESIEFVLYASSLIQRIP